MDSPADTAAINGWHAHIYYDPDTRDRAAELREWVGARFPVTLGRWHDAKVGPHAKSMYQIAFGNEVFPQLVPFLALNRMGLTVLVHPNTKRALDDHLLHAMWLGEVLPITEGVLTNEAE